MKRKGGRVQNLRLGQRLMALLAAHLEQRRPVSGDERALFLSRQGSRASVRTLQRLTERLRNHLGFPLLTSHSARHSFVSNSIAEGGELLAVSRAAGHAKLTTTQSYAHVADPLYRRIPVIAERAMIPLEALPVERAQALREAQAPSTSCPACGCNRVHLGALDELQGELKRLDVEQPLDDAAA